MDEDDDDDDDGEPMEEEERKGWAMCSEQFSIQLKINLISFY